MWGMGPSMRQLLALRLSLYLVALGLGFFLGVMVAKAEEHDHAQLGSAGEFYAKWNMPNSGRPRTNSCCSMHDCYATAIKNVGGTWFGRHRETGKWVVIPDSKLEELQPDERESPDGQSHMCASATGNVYCAVRGAGI